MVLVFKGYNCFDTTNLSQMHPSRLTILNTFSPEHFCSKFLAKLSLVFEMLHKYLQHISWRVNLLYLGVMHLVLLHISVLNAPL